VREELECNHVDKSRCERCCAPQMQFGSQFGINHHITASMFNDLLVCFWRTSTFSPMLVACDLMSCHVPDSLHCPCDRHLTSMHTKLFGHPSRYMWGARTALLAFCHGLVGFSQGPWCLTSAYFVTSVLIDQFGY